MSTYKLSRGFVALVVALSILCLLTSSVYKRNLPCLLGVHIPSDQIAHTLRKSASDRSQLTKSRSKVTYMYVLCKSLTAFVTVLLNVTCCLYVTFNPDNITSIYVDAQSVQQTGWSITKALDSSAMLSLEQKVMKLASVFLIIACGLVCLVMLSIVIASLIFEVMNAIGWIYVLMHKNEYMSIRYKSCNGTWPSRGRASHTSGCKDCFICDSLAKNHHGPSLDCANKKSGNRSGKLLKKKCAYMLLNICTAIRNDLYVKKEIENKIKYVIKRTSKMCCFRSLFTAHALALLNHINKTGKCKSSLQQLKMTKTNTTNTAKFCDANNDLLKNDSSIDSCGSQHTECVGENHTNTVFF